MVDRGILHNNGAFPFPANLAAVLAPASSISSNSDKRFIPPNFQPGSWDVVCHNGKEPQEHVGNKRFKICIENYWRSYTKAATRSAKSAVISDIVSSIRESSTQKGGGFVRFDASHCLWYEVGDKVARDKVGQALRDSIRARGKEVREKKREPCPSSQVLVQCDFRPKEEKMKLFELSATERSDRRYPASESRVQCAFRPEKEKMKVFKVSSVEHSDTCNSMSYASTAVREQTKTAPPKKRSTSVVPLESGSNGLKMLCHEIAGMDGKPCSTDAWHPGTESLLEWFENDVQGIAG